MRRLDLAGSIGNHTTIQVAILPLEKPGLEPSEGAAYPEVKLLSGGSGPQMLLTSDHTSHVTFPNSSISSSSQPGIDRT